MELLLRAFSSGGFDENVPFGVGMLAIRALKLLLSDDGGDSNKNRKNKTSTNKTHIKTMHTTKLQWMPS